MIGDKKTLIIIDRECHFIERIGKYYDIDERKSKEFKTWVTCKRCGNDKFELSHGWYKLISRCSDCHYTSIEYDG